MQQTHDSAPDNPSLLLTDCTDKQRCFLNCAQFAHFASITLILLWLYDKFVSLINQTKNAVPFRKHFSFMYCTGHVAFNFQNCFDEWVGIENIGCTYRVDGEKLKENMTWPDRETLVRSSILTCHNKMRTCTSVLSVVYYILLHIWVIPTLERSDVYSLPTT